MIEPEAYPAEFTHGRPVKHGLPDGPLWPDKHSANDIAKLRRDSFTFAAQYMQRPTIRGGSLFKAEWLKGYDTLPDLEYRKIYADTAQKTGQEHDYSVFQCWGKEHAGPNCYLINMARTFWAKHKSAGQDVHLGRLRAMAIEDKVSGTALIQFLRRDGIPVEAIGRGRDKTIRARDVTPAMNCGFVHVPKFEDWYPDYEAELLAFPAGAHDDQIDPTIDAVTDMCGTGMTVFDLY